MPASQDRQTVLAVTLLILEGKLDRYSSEKQHMRHVNNNNLAKS